jgi:hypothetical protein
MKSGVNCSRWWRSGGNLSRHFANGPEVMFVLPSRIDTCSSVFFLP